MQNTLSFLLSIAGIGFAAGSFSGDVNLNATAVAVVSRSASEGTNKTKILENYDRLSLSFVANRSQTDNQVKFLSRGRGYSLFLTPTEAVLLLTKPSAVINQTPATAESTPQTVVRIKLVGANTASRAMGLEELPGKVNYFIGNDPTKWRTNIPSYAKVKYNEVYPGVDLVFYGNQRQLEFDFVIAPGFHYRTIKLSFEGVEKLKLDTQGNLMLHIAGEQVRLRKPYIYQEVNGAKLEISGGYVLEGENQVGFQVATHDSQYPLVIDPVLVYSTYLGGSGDDWGMGIAVDAAGNAYVAGWTDSLRFPTMRGAFQTVQRGGNDAFVTKVNREGNTIVYSTMLGGEGDELEVTGITVDAAGNAYVTGLTHSHNFPTTPGAFQTVYGGRGDAFVTKLNPAGSALVYSTYLGGSRSDGSQSIAVDAAGSAYVTGFTLSRDFPVTRGAFQTVHGGGFLSFLPSFVGYYLPFFSPWQSANGFVTKLNPAGSALVYSTYLGGRNRQFPPGIGVDAAGNAYVTGLTESRDFPTTPGAFQTVSRGGVDAFVTKLNPTGSALVYSTFLGGSGDDHGRHIAVDAAGNAYVTGVTQSRDFPTTPGAFQTIYRGGVDIFVTKLNPAGSALVYSTFLGGSGYDISRSMAVDGAGHAYVAGGSNSPDFPTTKGAFQRAYGGGEDAFVTKVSPEGNTIVYSTLLGGAGSERVRSIALDAAGNAYVTGFTNSTNFPTINPIQAAFGGGHGNCFFPLDLQQTIFTGSCDAFIVKITTDGTGG